MQEYREIETKLLVDDEFVLPELASIRGIHSVATRTLRLRATYYDSEDLRLARTGTTLRYRTGEGRPCWTLKLGNVASKGLDREELMLEGPATVIPSVLQDLVTARLRGAALQRVVVLRTRRTSSLVVNTDGQELLEIVDDRVEALQNKAVVRRWRELEVERRDGGDKVAARVVTVLTAAGAQLGDQTPKAVRALGPLAAGPSDLPRPGKVHRKDPAGQLVRWSLVTGLRGLVEHDLGVRRGQDDAVHQLRVSCRRLRSDLRTFRPLLDDPRAEPLRDELAWLADSFGAARDLEVLRKRLRRTAQSDPLAPLDESAVDVLLAGQEQRALAHALETLRSPRYLVLLQLLHDVACDPVLAPTAQGPCADVMPPLVEGLWAHLDKRAGRLGATDPDADWHRARILAKRARYGAETAQVALGKQVGAVRKATKQVQELLGAHQDAAVAASRVLDLADAHPDQQGLAVVCGRLAERERVNLTDIRKEFLRFWKRLSTH